MHRDVKVQSGTPVILCYLEEESIRKQTAECSKCENEGADSRNVSSSSASIIQLVIE